MVEYGKGPKDGAQPQSFLGAVRLSALPTMTGPAKPQRVIPRLGRTPSPQPPISVTAAPVVGTTTNPPPFVATTGWTAMTFADSSGAPPDVSVAAGPSHIVETINTAMAVYAKNGTPLAGPISLDTFFATGSFPAFDPKVTFDAETGRFFLTVVGINDATNESKLWVAASQTSDPTGLWNKYILDERAGAFPDYPGLGFCSDKVVVTANEFPLPSGSFTGTEFWVIRKADLINGDPLNVYHDPPDPAYFTAQPAESQSPTTDQFMVAVDSLDFVTLHFFRITGEPGVTPVVVTHTTLPMNDGSFPPDARQPGAPPARFIDTGDDRFQRATWRNGSLWAAGTGSSTPPGDVAPRSCPRLMEISTTGVPTIIQDFAYGEAGFDYYFAALQTDPSGNLAAVFTRSGPSEYAGLQFAGRLATDPPNTISASGLLQGGLGTYDCTFCSARNRWGDYSGAAVDPVDFSIWVAGEFAGNPSGTNTNDYRTFIARLAILQPARGVGWPGLMHEVEWAEGQK